MWQRQVRRCSTREWINAVEADIHHANTLVAALPRNIIGGDTVQMKLCLSPFAPLLLFVLEWMDCSCFDTFLTCLGLFHVLVYKVYADEMAIASPEERRATLREFYAVIYPMAKQLEGNVAEVMEENLKSECEAEECGICMDMDDCVVLPNCAHSMCITCFNDWCARSRSCPFCRASLNRVASADLWVLTSRSDAVDALTLAKDHLTRFYLYIQSLPLLSPSQHSSLLMYNYLI
ncbi:E3 ubiquitin-protein ligase AIRP2-like isoform X2 [Salvia miltiorrhiza]|uniref:E3 ubiquitin-protein ligase AIRP2-like isoform X2 n=2 Tax=Salvia miltiorrhiza TaxID=226208 RepID=UPI0025AC58D2|nr:E3 ubiquitin-protein ligase AIRP2-like isoform X2 [Salvia miltiorrhiza]